MTFRKFYLVLTVAVLALACTPSNRDMDEDDIENNNPENKKPSGPLGEVKFNDTTFDFGKITDGEVVQHTYTFKNVGKAPMSIVNVEAQCGCTTPEWTKEVIPVGGEGKITATFNSSGRGGAESPRVEKAITVTFDNCKTDVLVLKFFSNIYAKPGTENEATH